MQHDTFDIKMLNSSSKKLDALHVDLTQKVALVQAAVNVSIVQGTLTAERAKAMSSRGRGIDPDGGQAYSAAALSLVYHPAHPFVPTLRADVRCFKVCFFLLCACPPEAEQPFFALISWHQQQWVARAHVNLCS